LDYNLPDDSQVSIDIYDVMGRRVRTLVDAERQVGVHKIIFNSANLSSGVYFCRLKTEVEIETLPMILLK
jgi:hypothetical protein